MKNEQHDKNWMTIPSLPCKEIEETLEFWQMLGYIVTYKMTRPYQYGVVERGGYELHFGRVKGMEASDNLYNGCLVMVSDVKAVYLEFRQRMKDTWGRIPHSGIPRISKMRPQAMRFTVTDVSGNCIIFISDSEQDNEMWEKADDSKQSPLQRAIARAIRFRDFKEDEMIAKITLDKVLKVSEGECVITIAEALIICRDLALSLGKPEDIAVYEKQLSDLCIDSKQLDSIEQKHNSQ